MEMSSNTKSKYEVNPQSKELSENFHEGRENLYFCDEKDSDRAIERELRFYFGSEAKINYFALPRKTRDLFFSHINLRGNEIYKITRAWYCGNRAAFELEEIREHEEFSAARDARRLYLLKDFVKMLCIQK